MEMFRKSYYCVVEGQQEDMYLKHIQKLISNFPVKTVTFNTPHGNADVLEKNYSEYDNVAFFDYDCNQKEFENNIAICDKLNAKAKFAKKDQRKRIYHAYSSMNFDL